MADAKAVLRRLEEQARLARAERRERDAVVRDADGRLSVYVYITDGSLHYFCHEHGHRLDRETALGLLRGEPHEDPADRPRPWGDDPFAGQEGGWQADPLHLVPAGIRALKRREGSR